MNIPKQTQSMIMKYSISFAWMKTKYSLVKYHKFAKCIIFIDEKQPDFCWSSIDDLCI